MFIIKTAKKKKTILDKIIALSEVRSHLINDNIAKDICRESGFDEDFLLGVPLSFGDLDVSAKTVNGSIILSDNLLEKSFDILMRYVIHELVHATQHASDISKSKDDDVKDYLDKDTEIEAFQRQIEYDSKKNPDDVEDYVEELIEYHNVGPGSEEREDKKEELMKEVD